jgi:hypothetical protein
MCQHLPFWFSGTAEGTEVSKAPAKDILTAIRHLLGYNFMRSY